jgi:hypothetical protein
MGTAGERRAPRVQRPFLVRYRAADDARGTWGMSPIKDLGVGGVRFLAEARLAVGQRLSLELRLPTAAAPLGLEGSVAWARSAPMGLTEYGVKLHPADAAARRVLEEAVRRFASGTGGA